MSASTFAHQLIRASAGTGKTHRLTNRYLGLLAAGVEPDAILATTFTRKAAGEILDRVLKRLADAAGDAKQAKDLARQIHATKDAPQDFVPLLRRMVQSLHRVRIATLDSFYIQLAGSFHLEIGLPAGWSICEEADDEALRQEALERLLETEAEAIGKLVPLLSKGETKRSVHGELLEVIGHHYECFRGSEPSAWICLAVPQPLASAERNAVLDQLRALDLSACGHKGFLTARAKDIDRFELQQWEAFLASGLAGKALYYNKPVPQECQALYGVLRRHATSEVVGKLVEQTKATWALLDRFHRELWDLKQTRGQLYFHDVTQALVDAIKGEALRPDAFAFRLDGAIEHLLLDEFQDTSLAQWRVLQPLAEGIARHDGTPPRSFFCVGDVKQAIYAWRGGLAEILNTLPVAIGQLREHHLLQSWRSAQPIIDVVNQVFGNLSLFDPDAKYRAGLDAWAKRFQTHTTARKDEPGYVCLHTGPAQAADEGIVEQRGRHCEYVARKIRALVQQVPQALMGVLCRTNEAVARMIYELRQPQESGPPPVDASEEGGNRLTDSPAVELILSLFTLADHPGHSIAVFHLENSPLSEHLGSFADPDAMSRRLRCELLAEGYGPFTYKWAKRLVSSCNQRDLSRLQQLVEMAYAFQLRSTLRADDFVRWVRQQRVPDPSPAKVRVMTVHGAKGLQFDIVVLPELDSELLGRKTPPFVVRRDAKSLDVNFVCRYANKELQALLTTAEQQAFEQDAQRRVEDSLSTLYVAMTRAVHALYLFIPGPRARRCDPPDAWYNLLRQTLAPNTPWTECDHLYEHGDAEWFNRLEPSPAVPLQPEKREAIAFRKAATAWPRGLSHVAPSRREGQAIIRLDRLFHPSEGRGMLAGTIFHAWFETIGWLEDHVATDDDLRAAAKKACLNVPAMDWPDLDPLLTEFRKWLQDPAISGVLQRSAYTDQQREGFRTALAPLWVSTIKPQLVERERVFMVWDQDEAKFLNGSLDRVVWLGDSERTVAADVLDFKTDDVLPEDEAALQERTEHYRPQMQAYRRAVARLAQLEETRVGVRLVFTKAGRVIAV